MTGKFHLRPTRFESEHPANLSGLSPDWHVLGLDQLRFVQTLIQLAGLYQFTMLALGDDPSVIHDHYHICADDRAESVRYDEGRSVLHDLFDGIMDLGFAVGIDLAGGLVKN
jgi:hypothetical protein